MDDSILLKIKALPPLDDTVIKIQSICMDKESSLADLSKTIEQDPMLTANILKAANSPLYGFSREVKNINHAVSLFGMATVRGFALSSAIRQNIKIDFSPYGITNDQFLKISTLQSSLMLNWYSKVDRKMLDILIPASFLMEIGKIILAHEVIDAKEQDSFLQSIKSVSNPKDLSVIERDKFGIDNEEIASKIFEQWNLELELVEAIRYSNTPTQAPTHIQPYAKPLYVVKDAVNIYDSLSSLSIERSIATAQNLGFDKNIYVEAVSKVKQ